MLVVSIIFEYEYKIFIVLLPTSLQKLLYLRNFLWLTNELTLFPLQEFSQYISEKFLQLIWLISICEQS